MLPILELQNVGYAEEEASATLSDDKWLWKHLGCAAR